MPNDHSRFAKYKTAELNGLWKPLQGETRTAKLIGDHEYQPPDKDRGPIPVLDLEDDLTGEQLSWRAGPWRAVEELERVDPQIGDTIKITRLADRGQSHDYLIERQNPEDLAERAEEIRERDDSVPF